MEFSAAHARVENRSRFGDGQYSCPQARRIYANDSHDLCRSLQPGRRAPGCGEYRDRGRQHRCRAAPVLPSPVTIFTTPGGTPAWLQRSAKIMAVIGVYSAGLRTTVLPIAKAGAIFHASMSSGKFHGIICPQTPKATRSERDDGINCAWPA